MDWTKKRVVVTGGASFIGSHLVDALVEREAIIAVIDDLSSGRIENIRKHLQANKIEFRKGDLREQGILRTLLKEQRTQYIFHLAADHGGRGYVDLHNAQCATNLFLDGLVFYEAVKSPHTQKVIYASSGCVYPNDLQTDVEDVLFLSENLVGPPYYKIQNADNAYGWAKLMAEMTLHAYVEGGRLPAAASCRYFTVYGPRGKTDHAVMAMLARAFCRQAPFEVWGDGTQIRNWTYVDDIVSGTLACAEYPKPYCAVNLGTQERISVVDAVRLAIDNANRIRKEDWNPSLKFLPDMPTGPLNRVCDNSHAKDILAWEPQVPFKEGIVKTADWFFSTHKAEEVETMLQGLTER